MLQNEVTVKIKIFPLLVYGFWKLETETFNISPQTVCVTIHIQLHIKRLSDTLVFECSDYAEGKEAKTLELGFKTLCWLPKRNRFWCL